MHSWVFRNHRRLEVVYGLRREAAARRAPAPGVAPESPERDSARPERLLQVANGPGQGDGDPAPPVSALDYVIVPAPRRDPGQAA